MFKIESVEIEGFWGKHVVYTELYDDVNIFIGENGTGKTTFINLLQSTLSVDIFNMNEFAFEKMIIRLKKGKMKRVLYIEKQVGYNKYNFVKYKIGNSIYEFPLISQYLDIRTKKKFQYNYSKSIEDCKAQIRKLVRLDWLSIHRELSENEEIDEIKMHRGTYASPVDHRLKQLMERFKNYQMEIESNVLKLAYKYETEVLSGLLYNEEFDKFSMEDDININTSNLESNLIQAFYDLNMLNKEIKDKIKKHSKVIQNSIENIRSAYYENASLSVADVLPVVLARRTNYMIDLSKQLEKQKEQIYQPINNYLKKLEEFMFDKEILISEKGDQPIKILKDNEIISLNNLSSGEKQLIILLTETLLQENQRCIFIADEPELSLHISWQRNLLKSIVELNNNSQTVVATHSPEIAALWTNKIINMKDIIHD